MTTSQEIIDQAPPIDPIMLRSEVTKVLGRSSTTLLRLAKLGLITKPVTIGSAQRAGWPESEVRAFLAADKAELPDEKRRRLTHSLQKKRADEADAALSKYLN